MQPKRPVEVPPWFNLHPFGSVVENYEPPAHAVKALRPPSLLANLRDNFLTMTYGRESVLRAPTHVATDSKGRLIIVDTDENVIHVLDGKDSFRIACGTQRRLVRPNGLAVDADDNIYVADSKQGLIQVFDRGGYFVRSIGEFEDESMFDNPTGIAIDRDAERLYVLDAGDDQLVVLDLAGKVLARVGGRRNRESKVKFANPSEVAVGNGAVVILDSDATRIQVLDSQGNLRSQFDVRNLAGPPDGLEMGLALDAEGRIYLSNTYGSSVRVFAQSGRQLGAIEQFGILHEAFAGPAGIWVDGKGAMYVSDTDNSRVRVFQLAREE